MIKRFLQRFFLGIIPAGGMNWSFWGNTKQELIIAAVTRPPTSHPTSTPTVSPTLPQERLLRGGGAPKLQSHPHEKNVTTWSDGRKVKI